jgi:formylglycine-generating enzyme
MYKALLHPGRDEMERVHNEDREIVWAYGRTKNHAKCATGSFKTPGCPGGGYDYCGSNTHPAGSFPACVSPFGAYDQHGNVAEHMNLPLRPDELASRGGYGWTEMNGSWFIFARRCAVRIQIAGPLTCIGNDLP